MTTKWRGSRAACSASGFSGFSGARCLPPSFMNFLAKRSGGAGGAQQEAFEDDDKDGEDGDEGGEDGEDGEPKKDLSPVFQLFGFLGFLSVSCFLLVFFFPLFLLLLFLFLPFFFWFWDPVLLLSRVIYIGFHSSVFMDDDAEKGGRDDEEDKAEEDIRVVRASIHNLLLVYVAYLFALGYFFSLFYLGDENFTRFYFDSFVLVCGDKEKPRYAVKDDGDGEAAVINDLLERNHNALFEQKLAAPFNLGNVISYSFIPISCSRICFVNLGVFLELLLGKNRRVIFLVLFFLSYLSLFALFSFEDSLTDVGLACALPLVLVFIVLDYATIFLKFAKEIKEATSTKDLQDDLNGINAVVESTAISSSTPPSVPDSLPAPRHVATTN